MEIYPKLEPLNNNNSYTTEDAWGYPNNRESPFYEKMGRPYDMGVWRNANYISDEDLYDRMWKNIKRFEDVIPYSYLDTKGNTTIGAGANVNDWETYRQLKANVGDVPATEAQLWSDYSTMQQMSDEKYSNGNYKYRNIKADAFKPYTKVRISEDEARNLAQNHMINDLEHVRREFKDFDNFPLPLKEVLLDIQYNTGKLNSKNWPNLYQAISDKNILDENGIIDNVNRKDVGQDRNDWAKEMIRSMKSW